MSTIYINTMGKNEVLKGITTKFSMKGRRLYHRTSGSGKSTFFSQFKSPEEVTSEPPL